MLKARRAAELDIGVRLSAIKIKRNSDEELVALKNSTARGLMMMKKGSKHTEAVKQKISAALKGKPATSGSFKPGNKFRFKPGNKYRFKQGNPTRFKKGNPYGVRYEKGVPKTEEQKAAMREGHRRRRLKEAAAK